MIETVSLSVLCIIIGACVVTLTAQCLFKQLNASFFQLYKLQTKDRDVQSVDDKVVQLSQHVKELRTTLGAAIQGLQSINQQVQQLAQPYSTAYGAPAGVAYRTGSTHPAGGEGGAHSYEIRPQMMILVEPKTKQELTDVLFEHDGDMDQLPEHIRTQIVNHFRVFQALQSALGTSEQIPSRNRPDLN